MNTDDSVIDLSTDSVDNFHAERLVLKNLPWPVSLNKLFTQNRYTKQIIKHPEAQAYKKQLTWLSFEQFKKSKHPGFKKPVRARLDFYSPDKRYRDIDNLEKILWDALQASGIIENDYLVTKKQVFRYIPKNGTTNGWFDLVIEETEVLYYDVNL